MTIARRTLLGASLHGASLVALPAIARGQSPERIRFVLNFRPDGGTQATCWRCPAAITGKPGWR
jgi:hypothetical protein